MATLEQDTWVQRVLGVAPAQKSGNGTGRSFEAARQAWQNASEAVDQQIGNLQRALSSSEDEELIEIGEYGLNALTGNFRVPLMATLGSIQAGDSSQAPQLRRIAAAFRKHLESDERVAACDDNPMGVAVAIRATLLPALAALESSVQ